MLKVEVFKFRLRRKAYLLAKLLRSRKLIEIYGVIEKCANLVEFDQDSFLSSYQEKIGDLDESIDGLPVTDPVCEMVNLYIEATIDYAMHLSH